MSSVFVVIVNYRTGRLVVDCLRSLVGERSALNGGKVVVVDNASGDDSLPVIGHAVEQNSWSEWVDVVALPRNGGFAYGNNAAIQRVRQRDPQFSAVVLLNPDAMARPGAIATLINFLKQVPEAGIAGASIEDGSGHEEASAHQDPSPLLELVDAAKLGLLSRWLSADGGANSHKAPRRCDWVSGACMAIRREVLDAAGPLDEGFFLYFEEVDYCARARRLGWSCWFVPQARIVHLEGSSTGIKVGKRRRPAYWYDSRRRYFVKRYGVIGLIAADLLWALGRFSLLLRRKLGLGGTRGRDDEPDRFTADLLIGDLRALLNGVLLGIPRHA